MKTDAQILTGHEGVATILADVEEKARNAVADAEIWRRAELEKIGKAMERAPPLRVAEKAAKVAVKLYPSIAPSGYNSTADFACSCQP